MGLLDKIKNRLYSDYSMPSRLDEYEKILQELISNGYEHITLRDYTYSLTNNSLIGKYFINRHDIDTDTKTARDFFEIEKKLGVKASYYFRLSTIDIELMREIEDYGSEASYHFEEIAQFAKDNHIKSRQEILNKLDDIKKIFKKNFLKLEKELDYKLKTVVAHGDFVNRKLKITSNELLKDQKLREELGIICEGYDKKITDSIDIYVADKAYPIYYHPKPIFKYIGNKNIIYMLTHTRQWQVNRVENTKDNIKRCIEGIRW